MHQINLGWGSGLCIGKQIKVILLSCQILWSYGYHVQLKCEWDWNWTKMKQMIREENYLDATEVLMLMKYESEAYIAGRVANICIVFMR